MDRLQHTAAPTLSAKRLPSCEPRSSFEDGRDPQHCITPHDVPGLRRMCDVGNAFVNRHAAADCEHEHAHQESPEVKLVPMTKRMIRIGRLATLVHTEQHQSAVA